MEAELSCCSDFDNYIKYFLSTIPHILDSVSTNENSMSKMSNIFMALGDY